MLVSVQAALEQSPQYKKFLAEEAAEEKRKLDAIAASAMQERRKIAKMQADIHRKGWSRPVAELQKMWEAAHDDSSIFIQHYWNISQRIEVTDEGQTVDEASRVFDQFQRLIQQKGWTLSPDAVKRLSIFCGVQMRAGGNAVTIPRLEHWFEVLHREGCFGSEVTWSAADVVRQPEQPAEPTFDDLSATDTSTAEGFRAAKYLADQLYSAEAAPICAAWLESLRNNFGFTPSKDDLDYTLQWFQQNNKSWLDPRNYDAFRLHCLRTGRWSPADRLMSTEEIRARVVDRIELNRDNRSIILTGSREVLLDLLRKHGVSVV